jgi:hypothetical protein
VVIRKVWNFLDLFGIIGGIAATLQVIFTLIVHPFADHSFALKAISSLYVLK